MAWKKYQRKPARPRVVRERRAHRVTHPILGPSTWVEMWAYRQKILDETGVRVCTWCHEEVGSGRFTRCGGRGCAEHIWQANSWSRCRKVCLRKYPLCRCGKKAVEVDHILPVSLGGLSDQNNLRGLCHECHLEATRRLRREKSAYRAYPAA